MKLEALAAMNRLQDLAGTSNRRKNKPSTATMQKWAVTIWNACVVITAAVPDDLPTTPTDERDPDL